MACYRTRCPKTGHASAVKAPLPRHNPSNPGRTAIPKKQSSDILGAKKNLAQIQMLTDVSKTNLRSANPDFMKVFYFNNHHQNAYQ